MEESIKESFDIEIFNSLFTIVVNDSDNIFLIENYTYILFSLIIY